MFDFDLFFDSFSFSIQKYESSFVMNDENEMSLDNFQQSIISIFDNRQNFQSLTISTFDNRQNQIKKFAKEFRKRNSTINLHINKEYVL